MLNYYTDQEIECHSSDYSYLKLILIILMIVVGQFSYTEKEILSWI